MGKKLLNDNQLEFFKSIVPGNSTSTIIRLMFERFQIELKVRSVKYLKQVHGLRSGIDTKFKVGQKAINPFLKGSKPVTTYPDGSERQVHASGYTEVKIDGKWLFKHRYIYEKKHGKIPKGCSVLFLDGDKDNFDIDNLILVNNSEMSTLNKIDKLTDDRDTNLAKIGRVRLYQSVKRLKDEKFR